MRITSKRACRSGARAVLRRSHAWYMGGVARSDNSRCFNWRVRSCTGCLSSHTHRERERERVCEIERRASKHRVVHARSLARSVSLSLYLFHTRAHNSLSLSLYTPTHMRTRLPLSRLPLVVFRVRGALHKVLGSLARIDKSLACVVIQRLGAQLPRPRPSPLHPCRLSAPHHAQREREVHTNEDKQATVGLMHVRAIHTHTHTRRDTMTHEKKRAIVPKGASACRTPWAVAGRRPTPPQCRAWPMFTQSPSAHAHRQRHAAAHTHTRIDIQAQWHTRTHTHAHTYTRTHTHTRTHMPTQPIERERERPRHTPCGKRACLAAAGALAAPAAARARARPARPCVRQHRRKQRRGWGRVQRQAKRRRRRKTWRRRGAWRWRARHRRGGRRRG
jgi:hypothetical protein